jgi:hypothetical protein
VAESTHWACSCDDDDTPPCVTHSALSVDDLAHIEYHRRDFTKETSDKMLGPVPEREYSTGRYVTVRGARVNNRSRKQEKQWRPSVQERSILRYTIG